MPRTTLRCTRYSLVVLHRLAVSADVIVSVVPERQDRLGQLAFTAALSLPQEEKSDHASLYFPL